MEWLDYLYEDAKRYCSRGEPVPCNWLYRNKSHAYFNKTMAHGGLMTTVRKDESGDPRSPINRRLRGLFFMAKNDKFGYPPSYSYFGPRRVQIRADELFRLAPNLYFADFYCLSTSRRRRHYVTLVMTRPESAADIFCQRHLIALDLENDLDNPFLFHSTHYQSGLSDCHMGYDQMYTSGNDMLEVEVFYTENLNIAALQRYGYAEMTTVKTRGKGHSTPGGKMKNMCCNICN